MFTKNDFSEKYKEVIVKVHQAQNAPDLGVAADMLFAHVRNRHYTDEELRRLNPYAEPETLRYNFEGYENFDYTEIDKDVAKMIEDAKKSKEEKGFKF